MTGLGAAWVTVKVFLNNVLKKYFFCGKNVYLGAGGFQFYFDPLSVFSLKKLFLSSSKKASQADFLPMRGLPMPKKLLFE